MTQDDVIRLAKEAGFEEISENEWAGYTNSIEAFAKLVAAEVKDALDEQHMNDIWKAIKIEREQSAKVVEDIEARCIAKDVDDPPLEHIAAAIRARGQA